MPESGPITPRNTGFAPNPCTPSQEAANWGAVRDSIFNIQNQIGDITEINNVVEGDDVQNIIEALEQLQIQITNLIGGGTIDTFTVKVNTDDEPDFLEDQLADHHIQASAEYDTDADLLVEFDTIDVAGDKLVRGFVDVSDITDYADNIRQVLGHITPDGDSQWFEEGTLISFDDVGGDPAISHAEPTHPSSPAVTVGAASEGSEAADTADWDIGDGTLAVWLLSRIGYFHAGDEKLYAYFRKLSFDALGHLTQISAETRVEIDAPEDC